MKNAIVVLAILSVLLASPAYAETITTPINITTGSNQTIVDVEGWSATYNCNTTSVNNRLISFQRNFTTPQIEECRTSLNNLSLTMLELSAAFKDSRTYAPLYTQCFSKLTLCENNTGSLESTAKGKETSDAMLRGCQDNLQATNSEKRLAQDKLDMCNRELFASQEETKQKGQNQWYWLAAGAAAVWAYYHFVANRGLTTQSQIEKDIPR